MKYEILIPPLAAGLTRRFDRSDDVNSLCSLWMQPGIFETLGQMPIVKPDIISQIIASRSRREVGFIIEQQKDNQVIASSMITEVHPNPRRAHAASMMVAVHPAFRRKGIAAHLVANIIDFATNWTSFKRIEFVVAKSNIPAIALYERFGFKVEGLHEGYVLTHGKYDDVVTMALRIHRDTD